MLETLTLKNIAIIDSIEIRFKQGLNVISGETGAGKSIIIGAISLLLGYRANSDLIRAGTDEGSVCGLFDLKSLPWMRSRMQAMGFLPENSKSPSPSSGTISNNDDNELHIKRTIHRSGKHRVYINGETSTLSVLQMLTQGLIDLCSQNEHHSLMRTQTQMELIDRFGGLTETSKNLAKSISKMKQMKLELQTLIAQGEENQRKSDFLKFQIEELKKASLQEGEEDILNLEKKHLLSARARIQVAVSLLGTIDANSEFRSSNNSGELLRDAIGDSLGGTADEIYRDARSDLYSKVGAETLGESFGKSLDNSDQSSVLQMIRSAQSHFKNLLHLDSQVQPIHEKFTLACDMLEEVSLELNRYFSSIDTKPERIHQVQDRLSELANLKRKYGANSKEMLETLKNLELEFRCITDNPLKIQTLEKEIETLAVDLFHLGTQLSNFRQKAAENLSKQVTKELQDLRMGDALFQIQLDFLNDISVWPGSGTCGPNETQFLVRTNTGEQCKSLTKIASGGELSRLMLSIRRIISDKGGIGVYLFDEIDAGIGGQTAFQVGKKLKSVAQDHQVICITHLPQVAAFADHHWVVSKSVERKRTFAKVESLATLNKRKVEIARMLGGEDLTKKTLDNAAELLEYGSH